MRASIIFLLFVTSFLVSFKSYGIGDGQLKVQVKDLTSDVNIQGAVVGLSNGFYGPFYSLTDSCGIAYLSRIPNGKYTLMLWHGSFGQWVYEVYVEAGELSSIHCSVHVSTHYYPIWLEESMIGSVYGNTSLYKPKRILTTP